MAEILLVGSLSHYLRRVLYIPGGDLRISEPSTVCIFIYLEHMFDPYLKDLFLKDFLNTSKLRTPFWGVQGMYSIDLYIYICKFLWK